MKKMLIFTNVISLLLFATLCQAQDQKNDQPPEITFLKGYPLVTVSGIFRNIAQARSDLHDNNLTAAAEALNKAVIRLNSLGNLHLLHRQEITYGLRGSIYLLKRPKGS